MLVPALFLVLLSLGAIAIDGALLLSAHRGVHRAVSAAADDAAAAIDEAALHTTGDLRIDAAAARRIASAHISAARLPGELAAPVEVIVDDDAGTVRVSVRVEVRRVLRATLPGGDASEVLTVSAMARLNR